MSGLVLEEKGQAASPLIGKSEPESLTSVESRTSRSRRRGPEGSSIITHPDLQCQSTPEESGPVRGWPLGAVAGDPPRALRSAPPQDGPADPAHVAALVEAANAAGLGHFRLDLPPARTEGGHPPQCEIIRKGHVVGQCAHWARCQARNRCKLWAVCELPWANDLLVLEGLIDEAAMRSEPEIEETECKCEVEVMTLSERIRALRAARGWNQRALAIKSRLSEAAVHCLERGNNPRLSTVAALASAFDMTVAELLVGVEPAADGRAA
ncbi:MAG: helix-turn-helix transcriptional regulator [Anaerolineae bacterium]|nr:helix-turn-helix transcriptional regulator [Anaerolineae bacterium]